MFLIQVVQKIASVGKKEIAHSHSACLRTLMFAGGAGLVTAATVFVKISIVHSEQSALRLFILGAANLILSFLIIQVVGFRLATKQSPLLGVVIAERWNKMRAMLNPDDQKWRQFLRWAFLTQLYSALGNFIFVIPAVFFLQHFLKLRFSGLFLDPHAAEVALQSLDPFHSGTIFYAAITGALLWVSLVIGGVVSTRLKTKSNVLVSGFFNFTLGLLLAMLPSLGKGLHLPLDVRHFTLSSGLLAVAVGSIGVRQALRSGLIAALFGVVLIGALNFSVSFCLAFLSSSFVKRARKGALIA